MYFFFRIFQFNPKQAISPYYSLFKMSIFHTFEKVVNFLILAVLLEPFLAYKTCIDFVEHFLVFFWYFRVQPKTGHFA